MTEAHRESSDCMDLEGALVESGVPPKHPSWSNTSVKKRQLETSKSKTKQQILIIGCRANYTC